MGTFRRLLVLFCLLLSGVGVSYAVTPDQRLLLLGGKISIKSLPGLALWLDASDASTITIATGVSVWADKSGKGNNATQGTGAAQPTVQAAAQNGKNTIRFTGASTQTLTLTSAITVYPGGYTAYAVVRRGGPTGTNYIELLGYSGNSSYYGFEWLASGLAANVHSFYVATAAQAATGYHAVAIQIDGTGVGGKIIFDGSDITTTNASGGNNVLSIKPLSGNTVVSLCK